MKKIAYLILIAVLVSGCMTLEYIPAYEQILGLDLRPFAEQNFLITPYAYSGKYTSIAVIDYKIMPKARLEVTESYDRLNNTLSTSKEWIVSKVETAEALEKIYIKCKEMGANALVDFEILEASDGYTNIQNPVVVTGIRITGLAIRRDDIGE